MKSVDYQKDLQKIIKVWESIKDVHPFLEKIFPVAIATDGGFLFSNSILKRKVFSLFRDFLRR
ncbi:hypothetical protein AS006_06790 [Thermotoga sp. SG1]|nr:hypothetical protein AS006_06790 [Thermotoga sp. SG1]